MTVKDKKRVDVKDKKRVDVKESQMFNVSLTEGVIAFQFKSWENALEIKVGD